MADAFQSEWFTACASLQAVCETAYLSSLSLQVNFQIFIHHVFPSSKLKQLKNFSSVFWWQVSENFQSMKWNSVNSRLLQWFYDTMPMDAECKHSDGTYVQVSYFSYYVQVSYFSYYVQVSSLCT